MHGELEKMEEELVVAYFNVLSKISPFGTANNHENLCEAVGVRLDRVGRSTHGALS
jgi:hypothetical protein